MNSHESINRLITRLQAIAAKNRDEFNYRIDIDPSRNGLTYRFVCKETADGHELLSGVGPCIESAIANAEADIAPALIAWAYKDAKPK